MELTLNARPVSAVQDDSRLVACARAGDDRAFEQLYARYRERIYVFILSKVRDHGRAEDIAQEVFMSALRQMRSSEQDLAFKPWLYTIARNACIDEFRRGSRGTEVPVESEEDLDAGVAHRPLLAAVPTPDSAVESKQQLDDLRGAFAGLTESQHQLLVLREFEGLSYDEIGDRLGMTKQMVESGLFRARRKLGEEYDELASGRRCQQIQTAIDAGTLQTVKAIGIRDRRRYARHLAHCQPCRHVALMTGVDDSLLTPRRLVDKVAALLPFPFLRRLLGHGGSGGASHAAAAGTAAQAAGTATSAGASVGLGQAATFAAIAVAGAGGGLYATHAVGHHHAPAAIHRIAVTPAATAPARRTVRAVAHVPAHGAHHARAAAAAASRHVRSHRVVMATARHARAAAGAPGGRRSGSRQSRELGRAQPGRQRPRDSHHAGSHDPDRDDSDRDDSDGHDRRGHHGDDADHDPHDPHDPTVDAHHADEPGDDSDHRRADPAGDRSGRANGGHGVDRRRQHRQQPRHRGQQHGQQHRHGRRRNARDRRDGRQWHAGRNRFDGHHRRRRTDRLDHPHRQLRFGRAGHHHPHHHPHRRQPGHLGRQRRCRRGRWAARRRQLTRDGARGPFAARATRPAAVRRDRIHSMVRRGVAQPGSAHRSGR